jgi:hypothetical protein
MLKNQLWNAPVQIIMSFDRLNSFSFFIIAAILRMRSQMVICSFFSLVFVEQGIIAIVHSQDFVIISILIANYLNNKMK